MGKISPNHRQETTSELQGDPFDPDISTCKVDVPQSFPIHTLDQSGDLVDCIQFAVVVASSELSGVAVGVLSAKWVLLSALSIVAVLLGCQTVDYAPQTGPTKSEKLVTQFVHENEVEMTKEFGRFILTHDDVPEHITGGWLADNMTGTPDWKIRQAHAYGDYKHWVQASISASFDDGSTRIDTRLTFDLDVVPEQDDVRSVEVSERGKSLDVTTTP